MAVAGKTMVQNEYTMRSATQYREQKRVQQQS
jgi:hypothetical protein